MINQSFIYRCSLLAIWVLICALPLRAEADEPLFERRVLGIYYSAEGKSERDNALGENVEAVLHYLGLQLEYHDLRDGLPTAEQMRQSRGAIVWTNSDRLPRADAYWEWLKEQLKNDKRIVLLNGIGPTRDSVGGRRVSLSRINAALSLMGLRAGENYTDLPLDIELLHKESSMVEFERELDNELNVFSEVRSIDPANEVYLSLRMKSTQARADAVVIGANGGLVNESYMRYVDEETLKKQWRINPFAFLSRALGIDDAPRLDYTTINGNRIYYSHIDGDGLLNVSFVDRESSSARIVYEGVLKAHPELPFTCSVIIYEVDEQLAGNPDAVALAKRIFALPNVEAASHTYSHPLVWNADIAPAHTIPYYLEEIAGAQRSGRAILPWKIPDYTFDAQMETVGSCRYIEENLLPPGKRCRLLLWSGNCLPDAETLAACAAAGVANMNGGDSRMDGEYPSYGYIRPLYRKVGDYYQIHSSNSNENTYTDLWSGPFGGFRNVIQTFENTETPRRVLPVNVYYHYYSGERLASLRALERVYAWVEERRDELFPVFASDYAEVVRGFIAAKLEQLGPRHWRVVDSGACRTLRFDRCALFPDLERSRGIVGFRHYQGSLYVSLDEGAEHEVVLVEQEPRQFYLERATAAVRELVTRADGSFSFRSQALGSAHFYWHNAPVNSLFNVRVQNADGASRALRVSSNAQGILRLELPLFGARAIEVEKIAEL